MTNKLILTGDVNLMNVTDATVPFRHVAAELNAADVVFSNLECCLHLSTQTHSNEGFFADPIAGGEALRLSGIRAVGIANNVNYGAANIAASIARLDQLVIPHTGAGPNLAAARAPAIVNRNGLRVGVVQRSSVYWPTDHEAHDDAPGIAVLRGHTAYHVPMGRISPTVSPANRPGVAPLIVTWADAAYLKEFGEDIKALRAKADIVVASCHWGLWEEVLDYMTEIVSTGFPQIQGGAVKAIAMLAPQRSKILPDLPTAREGGVNVDAYTWNAIFLPNNTPEPVAKRLHDAAVEAMKSPQVREKLDGLGVTVVAEDRMSAAYLGKFVKDEIEKWGAAIKESGAKAE